MILILANNYEPGIPGVIDILNHKKAKWCRLNGEDIPLSCNFHVGLEKSLDSFELDWEYGGNVSIDLFDLKSIWYRRKGTFNPAEELSSNHKEFVNEECNSVYESLNVCLPNSRWMNNYWHAKRANNTLIQLRLAKEFGLSIPETIITQSSQKALKFYNQQGGRVITKVLQKCAMRRYEMSAINVREVTYDQLVNNQEIIKNCPTLFQEKIDREIEIRVTVVGKKIFAVALDPIFSDKPDLEIYLHQRQIHYPYNLPVEIQEKILYLMENLGLEYGAIDFVLDKSGKHVFLEVNESGQSGWLEDSTGERISESIANWLMAEN